MASLASLPLLVNPSMLPGEQEVRIRTALGLVRRAPRVWVDMGFLRAVRVTKRAIRARLRQDRRIGIKVVRVFLHDDGAVSFV